MAETQVPVIDGPEGITIHNREGEVVEFKCGHRSESFFCFMVWGSVASLSGACLLKRELCVDCHLHMLRQKAIRCCACGGPILPGDGTAFGTVGASNGQWKETLFESALDGRKLTHAINCVRTACIEGAAWNGEWTGEFYKMHEQFWGNLAYTPINR